MSPSLAALYAAFNGVCQLCFAPVTPEEASADHIVPRVAGGQRWPGNLRLAHRECNSKRGAVFLGIDWSRDEQRRKFARPLPLPVGVAHLLALAAVYVEPPMSPKPTCPRCGHARAIRVRRMKCWQCCRCGSGFK